MLVKNSGRHGQVGITIKNDVEVLQRLAGKRGKIAGRRSGRPALSIRKDLWRTGTGDSFTLQ